MRLRLWLRLGLCLGLCLGLRLGPGPEWRLGVPIDTPAAGDRFFAGPAPDMVATTAPCSTYSVRGDMATRVFGEGAASAAATG